MAIVESNKQNQSTGDVVNTRSKFPLSYEFFDTHRFGEYHPHFVFDGVEGDKDVRLRSSHDVRSYTLKAPLLQDIQMKKDYFMVPMEAILPLNWQKWNAIPVNGDDVSPNVGVGVAAFWQKVASVFQTLESAAYAYASGATTTNQRILTAYFHVLIFGEYFYSSGCLVNSLGARGCRDLVYTKSDGSEYCFDEFFDDFCSAVASNCKTFTIVIPGSSVSYNVVVDGSDLRIRGTNPQIDFHTALQIMRDNAAFNISDVTGASSSFKTNLNTLWNSYSSNITAAAGHNYYLARPFAYQIVCAHYYSNDHIDYIFSASLYRELIGSYIKEALGSNGDTFSYNGISYNYDYCSAYYFDKIVTYMLNNASSILYGFAGVSAAVNAWSYWSAIFSFKRSLRFLDYFTGTRSQPLAVGDVNIDVNTVAGNTFVSAVDVTKGISRQRLLNAVNRVGSKWENYIELMSGSKPAPDFHNPFYLGHTSDVVFGSESEYTGNVSDSDKQNVTSVLRSNGGRYEFNLDFIDRPVVVLGVTYYDLPRVYGRAFERQTMILDRFDMFNKYMQFVGDQSVNSLELGVVPATNSTGSVIDSEFSYQNRDMQYKQRFNQLAGGFGVRSTQLDNWIYRADDVRSRHDHIDPDFIRSYNSEFDKFYVSLIGFSLGTYFHFIVRNINDCEASRPMAYAPSIL